MTVLFEKRSYNVYVVELYMVHLCPSPVASLTGWLL